VTAPPEGKGQGFVRYTERRRPLLRVRDVVAELERDPRFRITRVGRTERIITDEGEYGAVVTVDGLLLEAPIQHTLGFVFVDDFFSLVDGVALRPEHQGRFAGQVRHLTMNDFQGAGQVRRRRYYYQPPGGWSGVGRFLHTYWLPDDFPANPSFITVIPAIPVPPGSKSFIDAIAHNQMPDSEGLLLESMSEPRPLATKNKLSGSYWEGVGTVEQKARFRDVQVLEDGRFAYPVLLESSYERHEGGLALLRALVDTIEPIPRPGEVLSHESKESMEHWAE
jgi:hypothetical protein